MLVMNSMNKLSNPDEFIPERFLENGEAVKLFSEDTFSFQPFYCGIRNCIG